MRAEVGGCARDGAAATSAAGVTLATYAASSSPTSRSKSSNAEVAAEVAISRAWARPRAPGHECHLRFRLALCGARMQYQRGWHLGQFVDGLRPPPVGCCGRGSLATRMYNPMQCDCKRRHRPLIICATVRIAPTLPAARGPLRHVVERGDAALMSLWAGRSDWLVYAQRVGLSALCSTTCPLDRQCPEHSGRRTQGRRMRMLAWARLVCSRAWGRCRTLSRWRLPADGLGFRSAANSRLQSALGLHHTRALSDGAAPLADHPPPATAPPSSAATAAAAASRYASYADARELMCELQIPNAHAFRDGVWGDAEGSLHPSIPQAPDVQYADAGCDVLQPFNPSTPAASSSCSISIVARSSSTVSLSHTPRAWPR